MCTLVIIGFLVSAVRPTCIRITRLVLKAPNASVVKWVVRAVTIMHQLAVGLG